jgi:CO/xanthine dehydrogenase FAD-binding subunit
MAKVTAYHRPASLDEALATLQAPGTPKVVLAGGTVVNADLDPAPIEVVDLQALGLDGVVEDAGRVRVGATTTLAAFAADGRVPPLLTDLARREAPSTLRAMGTIGGLVAHADPESELLAGLLAHDAEVTVVSSAGSVVRPLAEVLAAGPGEGIITSVSFEPDGVTSHARTARTPGDRAIVAAVARKGDDGEVRLAMNGVAPVPVLIDDVAALDPPDDFRGSAEYRRRLATVLAGRARAEVEQ